MPTLRVGVGRRRQPAQLHQADGGIAGAGGIDGVYAAAHGADRALRPATRRIGPGASAVFRYGHAAGRRFHRIAGGKPRRAAHQSGRQSGPSHPGRVRCVCAGIRTGAVRSGSLAGADARRRDPVVGRVPGRSPASHYAAEDQARRGAADSDGDGDVANAGQPDQGNAGRFSGCQMASMGAGRSTFIRGGSAAGVWAARQHGLRSAWRGRDSVAGRRFPFFGARQLALCAAIFRAAPGARRANRNEPPLRGRADADSHGHQSRSPLAAAGRRCGTVRLESGGGAGRGDQTERNRLYVGEPMPTPTGTKADHRLPLRAADVEQFAWSLAAALGADTSGRKGASTAADKWIVPVVRDLQKHKGASLVIAGEQQSPAVHALAHAMNAALGNVGKTVLYTEPVEANPVDQVASFYDLVKDLDAGAVDLLLILGGNPAYNAPVELGFRDRLKKATLRVHLSLQEDETSELCHWHLPMAHYLETWSDCRAHDGTVTIMQPLIAPLYGGKSGHEVLTMLTGQPERTSYDIVKAYWATQHTGSDFEAWWRKAVHDGVVPNTALPAKSMALRAGWAGAVPQAASPQSLEVVFRPDPAVYDGRFANNGWLQEWPRPITQLTWDNAAIFSPKTAQEQGVVSTDVVEIAYRGYKMPAPVFIQPGHAAGSVTVHLGYGRTRAGHVGTRIGFNAYGMRTSSALWQDYGLEARKAGSDYLLVSVQDFHALDTETSR